MIDNLTIVILAGGKSSRMGEDKGLMTLYGKPMVEYVLEEVKKISEQIIIISDNANYKKFGFPVYKDAVKNKGPLAGIYSGLKKTTTEDNLILSCDVPYIKEELLRYLWLQSSEMDVTIAHQDDRSHQIIGFYKKNCLDVIESQLEKNELKIQRAFAKLKVHMVDCNHFPDSLFRNINSKQDI